MFVFVCVTTDFGLAQHMSSEVKETKLVGSPLYMAPEILLRKPYDASVDLWSVGVILYECLFGRAPYSSKDLAELVAKIQKAAPIIVRSPMIDSHPRVRYRSDVIATGQMHYQRPDNRTNNN